MLAEAEFLEYEPREGGADRWDITSCGLLYLAGDLDADLRRSLPGLCPVGASGQRGTRASRVREDNSVPRGGTYSVQ